MSDQEFENVTSEDATGSAASDSTGKKGLVQQLVDGTRHSPRLRSAFLLGSILWIPIGAGLVAGAWWWGIPWLYGAMFGAEAYWYQKLGGSVAIVFTAKRLNHS